MNNEKKIWLCEQYAHKTWTLSLSLAQEAANAGHFGKGYAVVAEETRRLADNLFNYAASARFDGNDREFLGVAEFALQTGFLAVNAAIEILRVEKTSGAVERLLIYAEDIRNISLGLKALAARQLSAETPEVTSPAYISPFVMPEIAAPIKSSRRTDWFFRFSVGGIPLVENTANIVEIMYRPAEKKSETIDIRGRKYRNVNCYQRFGLPFTGLNADRQPVMIIQPGGASVTNIPSADICAVPIDDLEVNAIFQSKIGYAAPPQADNALANYARECWDAVGGGQLVFADWEKLLSE